MNKDETGSTISRAELLARAAALVGGQRTLATMICAGESNMRYWLAGNHEPNDGVMEAVAIAIQRHAHNCITLMNQIDRITEATLPLTPPV